MNFAPPSPIGVYDSGIGGFSILREIRRELPAEPILYLADQAHVPYGKRPLDEVRQLAEGVMHYFLSHKVKLAVFACNTASAAALHEMRAIFPHLPIVGMEPAVKPAAEQTQTGRVCVLATEATFQGRLFESVVERFAEGVVVHRVPCPGLVERIESGDTESADVESMLREWLQPLLDTGIDRVVLGCTHYPLVRPLIERIVGDSVSVIDPAPAVARQARRILESKNLLERTGVATVHFATTGDCAVFAEMVERYFDSHSSTTRLAWNSDRTSIVPR